MLIYRNLLRAFLLADPGWCVQTDPKVKKADVQDTQMSNKTPRNTRHTHQPLPKYQAVVMLEREYRVLDVGSTLPLGLIDCCRAKQPRHQHRTVRNASSQKCLLLARSLSRNTELFSFNALLIVDAIPTVDISIFGEYGQG